MAVHDGVQRLRLEKNSSKSSRIAEPRVSPAFAERVGDDVPRRDTLGATSIGAFVVVPTDQSGAKINETPAYPLSAQEIEDFLNSNAVTGNAVVLTFNAPGALLETFHMPHLVGLVSNRRMAESIRLQIDDRYRDRSKSSVAETVITIVDPFRN
jgi:hypothetical protein